MKTELNTAVAEGSVKKNREKAITITKRTSIPKLKGILIRLIAIFVALIVAGIVSLLLTKDNPLSIYKTMFEGAFGSSVAIWKTLQDIVILLGIALAITPAFRMKFWNIGAEGQVLIGCLACAIVMFALGGKVSEPLLIVLMILASVLAGAIWGFLPAFFKAYWNTNETLFTLMMNYISIQLIEYFLKIADKSGSNTVGPSILSHGWLPSLFGQKYLLNIIVIAVLTVLIYFYMNFSKHGYEITVVGESENTARYIGINVKKVVIRTMILSGAICGLIGYLLVGVTSHSIDPNLTDSRGFTAIMVSWLAKFNPFTMILTSLLLVFLGRGAEEVSTKFDLNSSFSDIISGIILFFIIGCEFFINYEVHFNFLNKKQKSLEEIEKINGKGIK